MLGTTGSLRRVAVSGTTASATFDFQIRRREDVRVRFITAAAPDPAWLVFGSDYTVAGGDTPAGGTVTFTPALSGAGVIELARETLRTSSLRLSNVGQLDVGGIERAIEAALMLSQDALNDLTRAPLMPRGENGFAYPGAAARANKALAFDGVGNPVLVTPATEAALSALRDDAVTAASTATGARNDAQALRDQTEALRDDAAVAASSLVAAADVLRGRMWNFNLPNNGPGDHNFNVAS